MYDRERERQTERQIKRERKREGVPMNTTYFHALPSRNGPQWPQSAEGPHRAEGGHIIGSGPDRSQID